MHLLYETTEEIKPSYLNYGLITLEILLDHRRPAGIQMPKLMATETFLLMKGSNTNFLKKKNQ